jgi:amidase
LDLLNTTASDLSDQLDQKKISAEELMRATLAQIDRINPQINAIVALRDPDALLAEARAVDAEIASGPRKTVLHGLPMAVKDTVEVKGIRSTTGSPLFADHVPEADEILAARMRAGGAIFIGKTNVPEFGMGSHTFNPVYGATRNPYAPDRTIGGSSGGAAAALATRMLALADGSDAMGSLRNPAAWGNVYGFRPTWGRVPNEQAGDMYLNQLVTDGPMARSPKDLTALLDVIAGPDRRQPHGFAHTALGPHLDAPVRGRRIGWLGDWGGAFQVEPGILDIGRAALNVFVAQGCIVEEVPPPFAASDLWDSWCALRGFARAGSMRALYDDPAKQAHLKDETVWEIESGQSQSLTDLYRASEIRSDWFRAAAALFETYDALIMPSVQVWPFPIDWRYLQSINGVAMDTYHRWMECVVPVSLIGVPSLNIPVGFGDTGLPMGMQMFGAFGDDLGVLQLGQAYHRATDWPNARRPAVLNGA